jgi:hypothetical protein
MYTLDTGRQDMNYLLSVLVTAVVMCVSAGAKEVTFSFRGTLHEMDGEYSYFSGQPFEIIYSFDSKTDDDDPDDPDRGRYIGAITSGSLTIFSGSGFSRWIVEPYGPQNIIEVKKRDTAGSYHASASVSGPVDESEIPVYFQIRLKGTGAAALSASGNAALPASLHLHSFDEHRIVEFTFIGLSGYVYSTWGIVTSGETP